MRKNIILFCGAICALLLTSSCGVFYQVAHVATLTKLFAVDAHNLRTFVGNHKTSYEFELLGVENDAGILDGHVICPKAGGDSKATYEDKAISLTFKYDEGCLVLGLKTSDRTYTTIRWSDVIMNDDTQMHGKSDVVTLNHSSYSEGRLYVYYDNLSGTCRTFPLYVSQKKADEDGILGEEFKLTFPIVRSNEVTTYTVSVRITGVTVS